MKYAEIIKAVGKAQRFITAAKKIKTNSYASKHIFVEAGKESGALRRASMDLTRQLAEMRKP